MWRRLLAINISNTGAAAAGFGFNFFLLKLIGLAGFGEFNVLIAQLNLLFLVFILLPSSYAIFKLQDDENFKHVFFSFNLYVNIILAIAILLFFKSTGLHWALFFYVLTNGLQTYADTVLQSLGQTALFFRLLFVSALVKFFILSIFYFFKIPITMSQVWMFFSAGQLVFLYAIFIQRQRGLIKLFGPKKVFDYLYSNLNVLKTYYLYAALKRIQDSSPLLLFNLFISKEATGLFALLLKPLTFFVSLIRTIESFLTSRENFRVFHKSTKQSTPLICILMLLIFIPFCMVYMYVYTGDFYTFQCLLISCLVPLFVIGTLVRVEKLAAYDQSDLNYSSLIFIFTNIMLSGIFYLADITGVYTILSAYVVCNVLSIGYLYLTRSKSQFVTD